MADAKPQNLAEKYAEESWSELYSPNHEFWYSSGASFLFHFLLMLILPLLAAAFRPAEPLPPAIEVVRVDDSQNATGQNDDEAPSGEMLGEDNPLDDSEDQIRETDTLTQTEVTEDKPLDDPTELLEQPIAGTGKTKSVLDRARSILNQNANKKGGGPPGGGGEGNGGGRAGRAARWIINFSNVSIHTYLAQMEGLGAELAFPERGDNWKYVDDLTSPSPSITTRSLSEESRIFWIDPDKGNATQIAERFNLGHQSEMIMFLPIPLEERMLEKELRHARRTKPDATEGDIHQTIFIVTRDFDVKVSKQVLR